MIAQSAFMRRLGKILGVVVVVSMVGCSSAKKKEEEPNLGGGVPTAAAAEDNTITGDSDSGKAMGIQTIHFPFDSFIIDEEGKRIASSNADILKTHSNFKIQIEGHCDQRGGIQYNLALGEKRANAVRNYIADLGVAHDRMTIISFGKEKLIDPGTSEEAYARNRRANFVITSH